MLKVALGIIILFFWMILLLGIIQPPVFIWLLLVVITFIFYIGNTRKRFRRKSSPKAVIEDMEDYMERKAKERLGKTENNESSEKQEEEYDFKDDIEIIKK